MERKAYKEMLEEQKELLEKKGFNVEAFQKLSIQEREDILYALQEEHGGSDKPINHIVPLVSVCIPTYQHAEYIIQCLDGALMQKTTFPIEIIIGDDGSVDGTVETCKRYADKYPNKIRFFNEIRSLTRVFDLEGHIERSCNWWWTMKNARGKYIALCEGDDYWTDPLKLQKQVDFLEGHPEYTMCFHAAILKWEKKEHPDSLFYKVEEREYSGPEIFKRWIVATASVVFKASVLDSDIYKKVQQDKRFLYGDNPLFLSAAKLGRIYGMKDVMSVYRKHEGGAVFFHNIERELKANINDIAVYEVFGKEYKKIAINKICKRNIYNYLILNKNAQREYKHLLEEAFRQNRLLSCIYYFYALLRYRNLLKSYVK